MSVADPFELEVKASFGSPDLDEVRGAFSLLFDPGLPHAIQGLPSGKWFVLRPGVPFETEDLLDLCRGDGTYFSLNPVRPDLSPVDGRYFNNKDIVSRRWFLVDSDPVKSIKGPDGKELKKSNATDGEKRAALAVLNKAVAFLEGRGFPAPLLVDSGNGYHALYRVDLPNNDLSRSIVSKALKAISKECSDKAAKIDDSNSDAKRISKLPGTWARKGPHSAERPHRIARVVWTPEVLEVVPEDLLRGLAGMIDPPALNGRTTLDPWDLTVRGPETSGYVRGAFDAELAKVATSTSLRNKTLYDAALKLGNFVGANLLPEDEVRSRLRVAAEACGLGADGDPAEIDRAIDHGLEAGRVNPRTVPDKRTQGTTQDKASPIAPGPDGRIPRIIVKASEVKTRKVEWLWPDRIPIGKLTTWAGWGGLGKSFVSMDLAARVSNGDEIPGGNGLCFEPGRVLILNSEDDPEDTSVPRLIEAGADLDRISFLRSEVLGEFKLSDLETLDVAMEQAGGGVSLVVIDPAASHLGDVNDHKNSELRKILTPLGLWAAKVRVAMVLITHVSKPQAGKVEAAARVIGGVAWTNAVRSAVMFTADPDDKSRSLFLPFKTNNGPKQKGYAYRVVPSGDLARVQWEEEVDYSADEAIEASKQAEKTASETEVRQFVKDRFRATIKVPSSAIWEAAKQEGISDRQLKKAKKDLGIQAKQMELDDGRTAWFWIAPASFPEEA
jgi:hypothetical protein